ncbi:hypothetical protein [Thalassovita sp.]|uniref:hypothetical protein n=1 Tax=Thalassovita sp. TaxID=1979401 RepID=UPI002B267C33|nr:hypothetical protein [Thalassovita sp.]
MTDKTPERAALEARAAEMKLTFPANIGDTKLAERIATAEAKEAEPVPVLRVIGPAKGFRRAGRSFGAETVDIPLADLSAAEISALEDEPNLITARIDTE